MLRHGTGGGELGGRYVLPARAARPLPVRRRASPCSRTRSGSSGARSRSRRPARCSSTRGSSSSTALFSESGAHAAGRPPARCCAARAGFDLHSVREYEQGESLRKVHWRSTARRGQLMVKELEDAPRDEVAVLLDAAAGVGRGRAARLELRRAGARRRLDPRAHARARPPRRARRQRRPRARRSRCAPRTPTGGARSSCSPPPSRTAEPPVARSWPRRRAPAARALELTVVTASADARRSSTGSCSARSSRRGVVARLRRRAELRPGAAATRRAGAAPAPGRRRARSPCCAAATTSPRRSAAARLARAAHG